MLTNLGGGGVPYRYMEKMPNINNSAETITEKSEQKDNSISKKIRDRIVIGATMLTSLFAAKETSAQYTHPEKHFDSVPTELFATPGKLDRIKADNLEKVDKQFIKRIEGKFKGAAEGEDGTRYLTLEHIKDTLEDGGLVIDEFDIAENGTSFEVAGQLDMVRYRGDALVNADKDPDKVFKENHIDSKDVYLVIDKETGIISQFIKWKPNNLKEGDPGYSDIKKNMESFVLKKDGSLEQENYFIDDATSVVQSIEKSAPK